MEKKGIKTPFIVVCQPTYVHSLQSTNSSEDSLAQMDTTLPSSFPWLEVYFNKERIGIKSFNALNPSTSIAHNTQEN